MAVKWFSVKTLYRLKAEGRPEKPDLTYDPDATLLEERTIFIKATSMREAAYKAEREAKDYARDRMCYNPYNQKLVTYYMGFCDVYDVEGSPVDRMEIFSASRIISRRISDAKIARIYIGKRDHSYSKGKWRKFINREYNPEKRTN